VILRVVIIGVLLLLALRAVRLLIGGVIAGASPRAGGEPPSVRLVRDPVCGTHVPANPGLSLTSGGTTHYFCSEECRAKFRQAR
jgi:YHS domain-containing protein